jgi:haloalkane dehalogenase
METEPTLIESTLTENQKNDRPKILFTSSLYPYPTLPNNTSLTDATGARFSRADGIFCIISHSHHFANHVLAQNIKIPSVILEYPRWEDFIKEVKKGYSIIGISALPVHLESVLKMCTYIRENSPGTKILLGCYAGLALQAVYQNGGWKKYVDEICHGEGVEFMRRLLGEDTNRPIQQKMMPKGGGSPRFITKFPKGAIGFLVSGLGCPGSCDFCSSTALYDHRRIEMLSPADLVEHMYIYKKNFPDVTNVFVIEEDHFRWPDYLIKIKESWESHPDMVESLDWFSFGSLDFIGAFVERYGWDAILEIGIGVMFIGVESKFADLLHYKKRSKTDPREVFSKLHKMGIRTVGSWICGWDFHNHSNIEEDLNYFVALNPTYQQLTRLSPFPGTELWYQLQEEGRLKDVPWEDVHFWSGTQKNLGLEEHETLNIVEHGYDLLYKTWGPSLLRRLDVQLDGYTYCLASSNKILRDHKSVFFKKQCGMLWTLLAAMDRFAPNGIVRRRVQQTGKKYLSVIGEPTPIMQYLSKNILRLATDEYIKQLKNPSYARPKVEPFKKYIYNKLSNGDQDFPYLTEWPTKPSFKVSRDMAMENLQYFGLEQMMKLKRSVARDKSDAVIDGYLLGMVKRRAFGFGL